MEPGMIVALVLVLFPISFLALWCAIVFALASVGGWRRLAATYRASDDSTRYVAPRWQTGRIGIVPYRRVLTIDASEKGLRLAVPFPFRIGHQSLLIPWSAVHNRTQGSVWGRDVTRFDVGTPAVARVELPTRALGGASSSF